MADDFIQVAPNSTGAKLRTVSSTVGANTVHEQFVITTSPRTRVGQWLANAGAFTVQAGGHTATSGFWWLINPVGSSVAVAVRRVRFVSQMGGVTATPTSPRITIERMTFTGTASGAVVVPAKRVRTAIAGEVADPTNTATIRTASTGLTITAGEVIRAFFPVASATAVGFTAPAVDEWYPIAESGQLILAPGEGIVARQPDAGTSSDTRRITFDLTFEEYTAP
jgi:hypothetical protein